jgi:uncharacterized surface protein with fasciclin (FAS1) repeats
MKRSIRRGTLAIGVAAIAFLGAACSSSDEGASNSAASDNTASEAPAPESTSDTPAMANPADDLVGPGCAGYAKQVPDGAGSVAGMAQDPVAVAASNNPLLKTLVQAVSGKLNPKVNLVDTLNGGEFTVFAPVDTAFAKIPAGTINTLKTDNALLTKILTYHVVAGQLSPDQVVGQQTTVEKGMVDITGSGDSLKVNDANVICGGVHTANATVYLIDSVLMPKS